MRARVQAVKVEVGKRTYRITTDTGWTQAWWALTQRGLRAQVATAIRACGIPSLESEAIEFIVTNAREHGYVTVRPPDVA